MPGAEFNLDKDHRINLEQASVMLLEVPKPGTDILGQMFYGYGVRQPIRCHEVEKALEFAHSGEPLDLIVCDADVDGRAYDFIRRLRASDAEPNRFCPVIVLSGHTRRTQVAKARDCGANFVVAKPLIPLVLLERIFWVCADRRPFVELPGYAGPDRRFQFVGPAQGATGRRSGDNDAVGEADGPNLSQNQIDDFMCNPPSRAAP